MKLSTTTLGCPEWDLPTALAKVKGFGFDAIDFRGLQGTMDLWNLPEFSSGLKESVSRVRDSGLAVSCISTSICLTHADPVKIAACDEELARCADLCAALGCAQMRVFPGDLKLCGNASEPDRPRVAAHMAARVRALARRAAAIAPVSVLIETHESWTNSEHLRRVLQEADSPDVACCWDIKHTWWLARETAATTWERLSPWVRNTHWKDARRLAPAAILSDPDAAKRIRGAGLLVPPGEGSAPLADAFEVLAQARYDGWHTLEWEKLWHPHIESAETVFPRFVEVMRAWMDRLPKNLCSGSDFTCAPSSSIQPL